MGSPSSSLELRGAGLTPAQPNFLAASQGPHFRTSLRDPLVNFNRTVNSLFRIDTTGSPNIPDSTSSEERDSVVKTRPMTFKPLNFDPSSSQITSNSSRVDGGRHSIPPGNSLQDAWRFLSRPDVAKVINRGGGVGVATGSGVGVARVNSVVLRGDAMPGGSGSNGYSISEILEKLVRNQRKFVYGLNSPTKPGMWACQ